MCLIQSKKTEDPLFCFYGDDFTGSTDSMEALSTNGVPTILFLDVPEQQVIQTKFAHKKAFGVAGIGRTLNPEEMDQKLRPIFEQLKSFQPKVVHYKTCSTFDSSPTTGSIGKVIDIGKEVFSEQKTIPLLVGVPTLGRFTVFGNHFATVEGEPYRLDRHPTMSKHPITPMNEADLRIHLSKQTSKSVASFNICQLELPENLALDSYQKQLESGDEVILFDVLDEEHQNIVGDLLWHQSDQEDSLFVVGSSGVEYALANHFNAAVDTPLPKQEGTSAINKTDTGMSEQLLVMSGSCSPVTQQQIQWALDNGFSGIKVSGSELLSSENAYERVYIEAKKTIEDGQSIIIYSAFGPDDPNIEETKQALISKGLFSVDAGKKLGQIMGRLTKDLLSVTNLNRVVIAGGDTSGYATQELGIFALEMASPLAPGGPLCRCHSNDERFDGLEISLKGGQVGGADYFGVAKSIGVSL